MLYSLWSAGEGDKHALRTSCCAVAIFAWPVALGVACIVKHVHLRLQLGGSYRRVKNRGKRQREPSCWGLVWRRISPCGEGATDGGLGWALISAGGSSQAREVYRYVLRGYTFTASTGLGATDGVNASASEGLSSTAGVAT